MTQDRPLPITLWKPEGNKTAQFELYKVLVWIFISRNKLLKVCFEVFIIIKQTIFFLHYPEKKKKLDSFFIADTKIQLSEICKYIRKCKL